MIIVENLVSGYGKKSVLKGVDFHVKKGEVLSILGANGSGKSTLLKSIVGLLEYKGDIFIEKHNAQDLTKKQRASLIAYVPQSSLIPFDFNVLDIVLMGRFHSSVLAVSYSKEDKEIALEALKTIGIQKFQARSFQSLSGGEKQLVLIARAIAQKSKIIIMDEPVTGLDLGNQMRLLDLITKLAVEGKTIIQTTHYPDHALRISHKVLWIDSGEVLCFGEPKVVIDTQRIQDIYKVEAKYIQDTSSNLEYLLPIKFIQKKGE